MAGSTIDHTSAQAPQALDLAPAPRVTLATLSAVAGTIHLAMVPSHWGESVVEGIGFAVAGWTQLVLAVLLFVRPTSLLLRATALANLALVGVWLVSRTFGLPFGDHKWHAHDPSFIDLTCVGVELALVVASLFVLLHPAVGRTWTGARLVVAAFVPISVLAVATAALASPSARNHGAGSHGGHAHSEELASSAAGASHTHGAGRNASSAVGTTATTAAHGHGVHDGDIAAESLPDQPLDPATRELLKQQLIVAREVAMRYPTVADAMAGGYRAGGGFYPGIGAHYLGGSFGGGSGAFDPSRPQSLIFDGISPTSRIVGLMYYGIGSETAPEGFAGPNDHWHRHNGVCTKTVDGVRSLVLPIDQDVTAEQCATAGGNYFGITGWMVHAWVVPSWDSPDGVFSHDNRNLTCADGTTNTDKVGSCQGT